MVSRSDFALDVIREQMPTATTSYTKNVICRSIRELVDPSPKRKEIDQIWTFFRSRCAYCDRELSRKSKEGHIDHLVPSSRGGTNHISNRVLSCAPCSEKEKRDLNWKDFLKEKEPNLGRCRKNKNKISEWQQINGNKKQTIHPKVLKVIRKAEIAVIACYDKSVFLVRKRKG